MVRELHCDIRIFVKMHKPQYFDKPLLLQSWERQPTAAAVHIYNVAHPCDIYLKKQHTVCYVLATLNGCKCAPYFHASLFTYLLAVCMANSLMSYDLQQADPSCCFWYCSTSWGAPGEAAIPIDLLQAMRDAARGPCYWPKRYMLAEAMPKPASVWLNILQDFLLRTCRPVKWNWVAETW